MAANPPEEKTCASCHTAVPAMADKCLSCGAVVETKPAARPLWQTLLFVAIIIAVAKFGVGMMDRVRAQSPALNVIYMVLVGGLIVFGFYVLFKAIFSKKTGK